MYQTYITTLHYITTLVFFILVATTCVQAAAHDVVVKNLKMFVEGREYFIKGMCYNPVPIGIRSVDQGGLNGGGYCSVKRTPYGEWRTACFDSDFFDGGSDVAERDPAGPPQGWFQAVWERDFPLMKALGVNTIRMYNTNPTTKQASIFYPNVIPEANGKNHVPFMDYAQRFGFKVVFPLLGDYSMLMSLSKTEFKRLLRWQIDEVGNHTALLMWAFGNELDLNANQPLVDLMNYYIGFIKHYTQLKWNRKVPVTTAVVDLPNSYDYLAQKLYMDVFTSNAGYRGFTLTDLFAGNPVTKGWHHLSCQYNKPLFVGEVGWLSEDNLINHQHPNWINQIWKDIVMNINKGCVGAAFFEYSDEPYTKADVLQRALGVVRFEVNTTKGVNSTQKDAWNPDTAVRKEIIFDALASGTFEGRPYNMNSDPYQLNSRAQYDLQTVQSICGNIPLRQCPGNTPCSERGICDGVAGTCSCLPGWVGPDCATAQCPGSPQCSNRGSCSTMTYPPACDCQPGWTGPDCSVALTAGKCPNDCSAGNGVCNNTTGRCLCFAGWFGSDCSLHDISYPPNNYVTSTATGRTSTTTTASSTSSSPSSSSSSSSYVPTTGTTTQKLSTTTTQKSTTGTTGRSTSTTQKVSSTSTTQKVTSTTTGQSTTQKITSTSTGQSTTQKVATSTTTGQSTTQKITSASATAGQSTATATTQGSTTSPIIVCPSGLALCGRSCYDATKYQCFDSNYLCPTGLRLCGTSCYNPASYTCQNGQLMTI